MIFKLFTKHKSKVQSLENEIAQLKKQLEADAYFTEKGIQSAQQALRGYKWVHLPGMLNDSLRHSFVDALNIAEETDGELKNKIKAFLLAYDAGFFCSMYPKKERKVKFKEVQRQIEKRWKVKSGELKRKLDKKYERNRDGE